MNTVFTMSSVLSLKYVSEKDAIMLIVYNTEVHRMRKSGLLETSMEPCEAI